MSVEWTGDQYAQYNQAQREWALDFVHERLGEELGGRTTVGTGELRETGLAGDVLDVGCGDGSVSAWIATRKLPLARVMPRSPSHQLVVGDVSLLSLSLSLRHRRPHQVIGVDPSAGQLEHARKTYHSVDNLSFHLASATDLPDEWRGRFDMVLSFTALHWVKDHQAVLRQAHKVLKRGGLLAFTMVLSGPRSFLPVLDIVSQLTPWRDHLQHYTAPCYPLNPVWVDDLICAYHPRNTGEEGKASAEISMRGEQDISEHKLKEKEKEKLFVEAYRHLLSECGFEVEMVAVVPAKANADSAWELEQFVAQWLPHKQQVPEQLQTEFVAEVVRAYLQHTDQSHAQGELHMWFDLMQVKARRRV